MGRLYEPLFRRDVVPSNGRLGVVLADDSELMRRTIKRFLDSVPAIHVLDTTTTFAETLKLTAKLKPTAVLMDLQMRDKEQFEPEFVKVELLRSVKHILVMSIWDDDESKALAENYGATVYLDKSTLASTLVPILMRFAL